MKTSYQDTIPSSNDMQI